MFSSLRILSVRTEVVPLCANSSSSSSSHTSQRYILSTTLKHTPNGLSRASRNPDTIFRIQSPDVHRRLLFLCDKLSFTPCASKQRPEAAQMREKTSVWLLQVALNKCRSGRVNEPAKLIEGHNLSYSLNLLSNYNKHFYVFRFMIMLHIQVLKSCLRQRFLTWVLEHVLRSKGVGCVLQRVLSTAGL